MKILEILLPKGQSDRGLSKQTAMKIDSLQTRMNGYVDKILDPSTTPKGKEFLKSRLRDDYYELKDTMKGLYQGVDTTAEGWIPTTTNDKKNSHPINPKGGHLTCDKCKKTFSRLGITRHRCITENEQPIGSLPVVAQYEIYDRRTGETVRGRGPYTDKSRARLARDKLDNEYGGYRYGVRVKGEKSGITESVNKVPLSNEDFELVKELMNKPIPAAIAPIYLQEVLDDDELTDMFASLEETDPARDVRPIVVEWFKRVMPDQMHRFNNDLPDRQQKEGILSPLHGYDPHMYKGSNDPITGNAFGRR